MKLLGELVSFSVLLLVKTQVEIITRPDNSSAESKNEAHQEPEQSPTTIIARPTEAIEYQEQVNQSSHFHFLNSLLFPSHHLTNEHFFQLACHYWLYLESQINTPSG